MSQDALDALIDDAVKRNKRNEITGLLIYKGRLSPDGDDCFLQFVEGPTPQLEELKVRIKSDARHTDFAMLEEGEAQERLFPNWSMGLRHMDDERYADLEAYADIGSPEFWTRAQNGEFDHALDLMRFFSEQDV